LPSVPQCAVRSYKCIVVLQLKITDSSQNFETVLYFWWLLVFPAIAEPKSAPYLQASHLNQVGLLRFVEARIESE